MVQKKARWFFHFRAHNLLYLKSKSDIEDEQYKDTKEKMKRNFPLSLSNAT